MATSQVEDKNLNFTLDYFVRENGSTDSNGYALSDNDYIDLDAKLEENRLALMRKYSRTSYQKHREKKCKYQRDWRLKDPDLSKQRVRISGKKHANKIRTIVLSHYSNNMLRCACCGLEGLCHLTLDHIFGGGDKHRTQFTGSQGRRSFKLYKSLIKNKFPSGYQVLCFACNLSKGKNHHCQIDHSKDCNSFADKLSPHVSMKAAASSCQQDHQSLA
jgi:hypothetical protein